jgi:hypothetical protein
MKTVRPDEWFAGMTIPDFLARLLTRAARVVLVLALFPTIGYVACAQNDPPLKVGVWVKPRQPGPQTIDDLETTAGRKFDYSLHYERLRAPFPSDAIAEDKKMGRIPIVSLNCGSIPDVAAGAQDDALRHLASSMAAYGAPVELRYCWEMNGAYRHIDAADFVPAWRHVHDIFASANAHNVRFYFCPGAEKGRAARGLPYYPGDQYVDDIGVDVYDRRGEGFDAMLAEPYGVYAGIDKPFIIGETGALATQDQATFLTPETLDLIRRKYPRLRGIVYFDAGGPHGDWSLSGPGLAAFAAFAKAAQR